MVSWSDTLAENQIVLADPFIITFIISFNILMETVFIAPKDNIDFLQYSFDITTQGYIAMVLASVTIVVLVVFMAVVCIAQHKKQVALYKELQNDENKSSATIEESGLLENQDDEL